MVTRNRTNVERSCRDYYKDTQYPILAIFIEPAQLVSANINREPRKRRSAESKATPERNGISGGALECRFRGENLRRRQQAGLGRSLVGNILLPSLIRLRIQSPDRSAFGGVRG